MTRGKAIRAASTEEDKIAEGRAKFDPRRRERRNKRIKVECMRM